MPPAEPPGCGGGKPCVFLGKDLGWQIYDPSVENDGSPLPYPPTSDSWNRSESTLYLTISSFRDKLCSKTLYNLYTKAKFPSRIFVGVVQQNAADDEDCFDAYCVLMKSMYKNDKCPYAENIRMDRYDSRKAKGPTWARAKGSLLMRDEEFCMQTDSHMDFVPDWEAHMMHMWAQTGNEYGILSTYVADSAELKYNINDGKGLNGLHEVPHLCMVTLFGANNLIRNWGTKCARMLPKPKLTNMIWGAGLSFSKCHAERKVPYDPHTPYIFDGEEFSRAIRYWTYGYDIYSPNRVFIVHNYVVSQADPKHSAWYSNGIDHSEGSPEDSTKRLKMLLGIPRPMMEENDAFQVEWLRRSKYGLGDRRTFQQAIEFSGVDLVNTKILSNRCGNIKYITFKQHPLGPNYIYKFHSTSESYEDIRDPFSIYYNSNNDSQRLQWETFYNTRQMAQQQQQYHMSNKDSTTDNPPELLSKDGLEEAAKIINEVSNKFKIVKMRSQQLPSSLSSLNSERIYKSGEVLLLMAAIIGFLAMILSSRRFHVGKKVANYGEDDVFVYKSI